MTDLETKILSVLNESLTIGQLSKALLTAGTTSTKEELRKALGALRKAGTVAVTGAKRSAAYSKTV